MARIVETKEIPLSALSIGKGQVRTRKAGREIDELAASIAKVGLLEPIVVCPAAEEGMYEIITGQRRFLAHVKLHKPTILACVLSDEVSEVEAKILSLTENLVRTELPYADLVDVCTFLYKKYGTVKSVVEETGLPYSQVSAYVKYDRLTPELKKLVDDEGMDIKVALRAQDAAMIGGEYEATEAVRFARELAAMSGAQQRRLLEEKEKNPEIEAGELIELVKTQAKIQQIIVTLGSREHQALQRFAREEDTTQDEAAAALIRDGLLGKGYAMEESEE